MKFIQIIFAGIVIGLCSCEPNNTPGTVPSTSCSISTPAEEYFKYEAAQLAVNQIFSEGTADTGSVSIPTDYYNAYLKALGLVYDATNVAQRDSVINKQLVSEFNYCHSIVVGTGSTWADHWFNGIVPTGNTAVDNAISQYGLTITAGPFANPLPMYIIESNQPTNGKALARLFQGFPDVNFAEPNTYYGFYSKLTGSFNGDVAHLVFYEGWGDCPAGCFGYHRWEFDVNLTTCSVSFTGYYS
jgi:hypothetical protein